MVIRKRTALTKGYSSKIGPRYLFFRSLDLNEYMFSWTTKGRIVLLFDRSTDGYTKMAGLDHFGRIIVTLQSI